AAWMDAPAFARRRYDADSGHARDAHRRFSRIHTKLGDSGSSASSRLFGRAPVIDFTAESLLDLSRPGSFRIRDGQRWMTKRPQRRCNPQNDRYRQPKRSPFPAALTARAASGLGRNERNGRRYWASQTLYLLTLAKKQIPPGESTRSISAINSSG